MTILKYKFRGVSYSPWRSTERQSGFILIEVLVDGLHLIRRERAVVDHHFIDRTIVKESFLTISGEFARTNASHGQVGIGPRLGGLVVRKGNVFGGQLTVDVEEQIATAAAAAVNGGHVSPLVDRNDAFCDNYIHRFNVTAGATV